jgi:hypothetical protein
MKIMNTTPVNMKPKIADEMATSASISIHCMNSTGIWRHSVENVKKKINKRK